MGKQQPRTLESLGGVLQRLNDAASYLSERHAVGRARGGAAQRDAVSRLQSGAKRLVDNRLARTVTPQRTSSGIGYASIFSWLGRDKGDAQGKSSAVQGKAGQRQAPASDEPSPQFVTDIDITGCDGDELRLAASCIDIAPRSSVNAPDVLRCINNLVYTGQFASVEVLPTETKNGVRLEFKAKPCAALKSVKIEGGDCLPEGLLQDIFKGAYGKRLNSHDVVKALERIDSWYRQNEIAGFAESSGEVVARAANTGALVIPVRETRVGDVRFKFVDKDGNEVPAKTKLPFVQRYISARPGETLRIGEWDRELQSIASLPTVTRATWRPAPSFAAPDDAAAASPSGAEGDVAAAGAATGTPAPAATAAGQAAGGRGRPAAANAADPPTASAGAPSVPSGLEGPQAAAAAAAVATGADSRLDLEVLIEEPKKFWNSSFQLGATAGPGISAEPQYRASFAHSNLFGRLQQMQVNASGHKWHDRCFEMEYTDPWLRGTPRDRAQSQSVAAALTRSDEVNIFGLVDDDGGIVRNAGGSGGGGSGDDEPAAGASGAGQPQSGVLLERVGLAMTRSGNLNPRCHASLGLRLGRNRCVGDNDTTLLVDPYQWPLTHSSKGVDHVAAALGSLAARWRWLRGVVSLDQALCPPSLSKNNGPWLSFTRMHNQAELTVPLRFVTARLTTHLGASLGDLPPYDAHPLGGVNCVRGWDEGALGTARHWGVVNAELERPLLRDRVLGVLFADAGSDFDSGQTVVGDPAGTRGKPGRGAGYGWGVRMQTPIGLLRLDYAFSDRQRWRETGPSGLWSKGKFHLGLGARF